MQTVLEPEPAYAPPAPPRKNRTGIMLAMGCGGSLLVLLLLGILGYALLQRLIGRVPPPASYVGTWEAHRGATVDRIALAADGEARYRSDEQTRYGKSHMFVNAYVIVDEPKHTLRIGIGPVAQQWHIQVSPHVEGNDHVMQLSGETFHRIGDYMPLSNSTSD